jgi:hypothetical protein
VFQVVSLMIAAELAATFRSIEAEHRRAYRLFRITGCKTLSVNLTQREDEGVAVFVADFAILVAVTIVRPTLLMRPSILSAKRQHPPAGMRWQLGARGDHTLSPA